MGVILRTRGIKFRANGLGAERLHGRRLAPAPVVVQGPQQLRGTELSRQRGIGPGDPRGLGLRGGSFPGDQAVVLKAGVGLLLRATTVASQPASLRDPSSDRAEIQKRRL